MTLLPDQITIAVTFYSHRQYVKQAIASALNQTVPVRVMVVEDCSPDPTLESFVREDFGSRIEYIRNPIRRGLFDNWNSCIENCQTEWLSILHDDDYLAPNFVEAMLKLESKAPGMDLYFGQTTLVNEHNEVLPVELYRLFKGDWSKIELSDVVYRSPLAFPGQLFRVSSAKALGGFRATSYYCGEWEMWAKMIAHAGAAQTGKITGFFREHSSWERGTNKMLRSGKNLPVAIVQHKRVLALFPPEQRQKFDRLDFQRKRQVPILTLLRYGESFSPRILRYYCGLLQLSPAPHWRYAAFKQVAGIFGPGFVRLASKLYRLSRRAFRKPALS
jgi:glycosyltransferase involved in cell wall biosynthesis